MLFDTASQNYYAGFPMKRILFFETTTFTGATKVTRTIAKNLKGHFETRTAVIDVKKNVNVEDEINKAIAKEKPDILFSSFSSINPVVITVGKKSGLMVIVRQDYKLSDLPTVTKQKIYETYPKADWIIVQTPEMKQELLSYEALINCRIKVIDNPLDEEDILEKAKAPNPFPDNGNFHFLWVGRRDPIKDIPTLQKAFEIVHKQHPNTDLTLVSDDPNPYRWIKNADCLVVSSISEASPNVLREALFLGTKVVSTECSPIVKRLLTPDRIAKVSDVDDLADKMCLAICH